MDAASLSPTLSLPARAQVLLRETWRYFVVSIAALALDYGLLVGLTEFGRLNYLTSSAISYTCGAIVQYLLSIRLVFGHRRISDWRFEFIGFFGIGLLGLVVTQAVLKLSVEGLGLSYMLGKIAATGLSFVLNFAARRAILFTKLRADT